jgi:hypothetical protein
LPGKGFVLALDLDQFLAVLDLGDGLGGLCTGIEERGQRGANGAHGTPSLTKLAWVGV